METTYAKMPGIGSDARYIQHPGVWVHVSCRSLDSHQAFCQRIGDNMNKKDLLVRLEDSHERVLEAIEGLSTEEMLEPGVMDNWSVKDILAHLTRWEAELIKLLWQARQGMQPTSLHFNQSHSVDEVNARWYEEDQARSLERILEDFHGVRNQTIRRLEFFTEKDLNDTQRYPWLGGQPLWEWVANDSFEHDNEHLEHLRLWRFKKSKGTQT